MLETMHCLKTVLPIVGNKIKHKYGRIFKEKNITGTLMKDKAQIVG